MNIRPPLLLLLAALHLPPATIAETNEPPLSREYLSLVMRHLYRWHLDETTLLAVEESDDVAIRWRYAEPALDEGDRSRYIELAVPQVSCALLLKKADYAIPELDAVITNQGYRIVRVEKYSEPPAGLDTYASINLNRKTLMDYLFSVRHQRQYPGPELLERMRLALRAHYERRAPPDITGSQTFYVAPISEVSNNLWVFWENTATIIRFSSDSDIATPAFWQHEELGVDTYDLKEDVVVSLAETAGSNAYVTRDWAARVLFNCVVFGKRLVVEPETNPAP